jgi:hypothetical protein
MFDQPETPQIDYVLGLDLGQASDYTALAVLQRTWTPAPREKDIREILCGSVIRQPRDSDPKPKRDPPRFCYGVRHLRRWPLGTAYTAIVPDVVNLVATSELEGSALAVDQTGVGAAVVDMLRQAGPKASLSPVLITGGHEITRDGYTWHVPKKELVSTLQVLLQYRRLKIANLPERELLAKELLAFRVKITTAANETFEAWRERDHDDMVLAVALAAWLGERSPPCRAVWGLKPRVLTMEERIERSAANQERRGLYGLGRWGFYGAYV